MNMQELRVEIADRSLRESSLQIHSQSMERYQATQSYDHSWREKDWLYTEVEYRERAHLKKFCFSETERTQQLIIDELHRQEKESAREGIRMILKRQAAQGYPRFPVIL